MQRVDRSVGVERERPALLIMDMQSDVLGGLPPTAGADIVDRVREAITAAREADLPVIFVVTQFRPGYPEASARNKIASSLRSAGRLLAESPGAQIHPGVGYQATDITVSKRRVGAFSATDLQAVLSGLDIDTLVLAGVSTSGVILSTVRQAADLDYRIRVMADCCGDKDADLHHVLLAKVLPMQAEVIESARFVDDAKQRARV